MRHGNIYDYGVNSAWTTNYEIPSSQSSPNNQMINNSPWQYATSDYASSTSPPGTRSSGGSPNSYSYSHSAEDLSVDSLISNLLTTVTAEDFGINNNDYNEIPCLDCTDVLCDVCTAKSLELVSLSKLSINSLCSNGKVPIRPMTAKKPPSKMYHYSVMPLYCEIHRDAQIFYCQTCNQAFCSVCGLHLHMTHMTVHITKAVQEAEMQATKVIGQANDGISLLRFDLSKVEVATETLNKKARAVSEDVVQCTRRLVMALESREKELLAQIEKVRVTKFVQLKRRDKFLRNGINRLSDAIVKLGSVINSSTLTNNPFDILHTKDLVKAEIFQIRTVQKNLTMPDESWITFISSENSVLHAIANSGSISDNNPGSIGDRRSLRGRGHAGGASSPRMTPQYFHRNVPSPSRQYACMASMAPMPRNRAFPTGQYPVTVRTGRSSQQPNGLLKPIKVIGNDADVHDNLCRPWGIACDSEGHIVVADRSNNRIQIYRPDGSFVRRFGTQGTGPGQFNRPAGVAVDRRKRIIVADKDNHRIQVLTMDGLFLMSFGEKGSRSGQFNYPWDVACNSDCEIAVSDTRNHRVQLFSAEGMLLGKYGFDTLPTMWKHFDSPRGVAFDPEGNVIVTDFNNHRVMIIYADFLGGRVLIEDSCNGVKQFLRPQGVAVDDAGNIIIADSRNHRIQIFDSTGTLKWKFGSLGNDLGEMDRPSGITLTPEGRIAVVDFGNNRVLLI